MHRRSFLRLLGLAGAVAVVDPVGVMLDPERALWVPGQKTIIDLGGVRAPGRLVLPRAILTPDLIAREALRRFEASLTLIQRINRSYDEQWTRGGAKIGVTVNTRRPRRFA